jgi:hypothetical protein
MIRNEVEYKDASHSEQIRASSEIVKVFQAHENIFVPYFLDNAEACTHYVDMSPTQVIKLYVSATDKTIRIVTLDN